MGRRMSRRTVLALGSVGIAGLAGCNVLGGRDGNQETSGPGWPIKIGVLAPLSGNLDVLGAEMEAVATLAKKQVDLSNNGGFTVDLAVKDTESDPSTAVDAATSLVEDGYTALVGPGSDESARAVIEDVLTAESALACSPIASTTETLQMEDDDLFYTTAPSETKIAAGMARLPRLDRVGSLGVIHETDVYGTSVAQNAVDGLESRGVTIQQTVSVESNLDSYTSQLETALQDDPEGLFIVGGPGTGRQVVKDFYGNFENRPTYYPDRLANHELPELVDADMTDSSVVAMRPGYGGVRDGQVGVPTPDNGTDVMTVETGTPVPETLHGDFLVAYRGMYDRIPLIQTAQAFDATVSVLLAAVAAGEDGDGAAMAEEIRKVINNQSGYSNFQSYGADDYWQGLKDISEGARNRYSGPSAASSGTVQFGPNGNQENTQLEALRFASGTEWGFEQIIPIQL